MSIRTIVDDLSFAADRDPDRVAVIAQGREVGYGELERLATGFAAGLAELGVRRGDRVAVLLPNDVQATVAIEGTWRAGAALAALNPTTKIGPQVVEAFTILGQGKQEAEASALKALERV